MFPANKKIPQLINLKNSLESLILHIKDLINIFNLKFFLIAITTPLQFSLFFLLNRDYEQREKVQSIDGCLFEKKKIFRKIFPFYCCWDRCVE